jgi:hypothetical protein
LAGWRFVISPQGFGSLAPSPGGCVHGVLWRLTPRDLAAINAYESVDSGLYLRRCLPVRSGTRRTLALVYITGQAGQGIPRPGYIDLVVHAAQEWELPASYVRSLRRWSPSRWGGTRARDTGELG